MNKPTLYIHIGTHKTGTTAVQAYFKEHSEQLKRIYKINNIHYSELPCRKKLMNADSVYSDIVSELRTFFMKKLDNEGINFLCWEGFSGSIDKLYANTETVLNTLKEAINIENIDVRIIVFFRRQDQFLQSLYNQKRHTGNMMAFDDFYSGRYNPDIDWWNFIKKIRRVFDKTELSVFPYDPHVLTNRSIIELVMDTVIGGTFNLNESDIPQRNIGFSDKAAKLFKELIEELDCDKQKNDLRRVLQDVDNKGTLTKYEIISSGQEERIIGQYFESNQVVASKYWQEKYALKNFSNKFLSVDSELKDIGVEEKVILKLLKENHQRREEILKKPILRIAYKIQSIFQQLIS